MECFPGLQGSRLGEEGGGEAVKAFPLDIDGRWLGDKLKVIVSQGIREVSLSIMGHKPMPAGDLKKLSQFGLKKKIIKR